MIKKLLIGVFIIVIAFSVFGCSKTDAVKQNQEDEVIINMPVDDSLNGYRLPDDAQPSVSDENTEDGKDNVSSVTDESNDESSDEAMLLYYANTNSKKFHKNSCRYAKITSNENLYITESREELINEAYVPCKVCKP